MQPLQNRQTTRAAAPLLAIVLGLTTACATRTPPEMAAPAQFSMQIREILAAEWATPQYFEAVLRLETMGPEVDAVLVDLARDPAVKTTARANALVMLAERGSPAAIHALRRALLTEEIPQMRIAAVLGLHRLADTSATAAAAIKMALGDPSRSVRMNALQALDIREVETLREQLEHDPDREVREVAMQLIALAENRGAPLAVDRRGALRTTAGESDPSIVFRPVTIDSVADYAVGDLRVEVPQGPDVPLASSAEVVRNVVPAFFAPDRSRVVFEADREIRVVNLVTRETQSLGRGVAPRLVPFTNHFVFLREQDDGRIEEEDATKIRYWVYRGEFGSEDAELVGELTATLRPDRHANYSPVRWMVVGEAVDGFVLRGQGISTFPLPTPIWARVPTGRAHLSRTAHEH